MLGEEVEEVMFEEEVEEELGRVFDKVGGVAGGVVIVVALILLTPPV